MSDVEPTYFAVFDGYCYFDEYCSSPVNGVEPGRAGRAQILAEAVRFELTEGVNPRRFSRPVP